MISADKQIDRYQCKTHESYVHQYRRNYYQRATLQTFEVRKTHDCSQEKYKQQFCFPQRYFRKVTKDQSDEEKVVSCLPLSNGMENSGGVTLLLSTVVITKSNTTKKRRYSSGTKFLSIARLAYTMLLGCNFWRFLLLSHFLVLPEVGVVSAEQSGRNRLKNNSGNSNEDDDNVEEDDALVGSAVQPHPDPNLEDYPGMVYVGRLDPVSGKRLSNDYDNRVKYIFGTAFDDSHKDMEVHDLLSHHSNHGSIFHDIPDSMDTKTREQVLRERRHNTKNISHEPKPFGHVNTHELDGGVTPVQIVSVEPFFIDATPVTNKQFARFVQSTYYETDAERYGWSYVLSTFVHPDDRKSVLSELDEGSGEVEYDPDAIHWMAVPGAYWRQPEGPSSTYKHREHHPVVHVSHHDAAEYCAWLNKRLPGEREYEAAARANQWFNQTPHSQQNNRTIYFWGNDDDYENQQTITMADNNTNTNTTNSTNNPNNYTKYANLWGSGEFPFMNFAEDGWRGTSPVTYYPPNILGIYDTTGNVWEWMRGGKLKSRIVRGASYVDTVHGIYNHAATLGARSVIHGTTTTGNVGFRCCKTPKKRTEHHYQWHQVDEDTVNKKGTASAVLGMEDQYGKQHMVPEPGWEDLFDPNEDVMVEDLEHGVTRIKKKVVRRYERLSTEL